MTQKAFNHVAGKLINQQDIFDLREQAINPDVNKVERRTSQIEFMTAVFMGVSNSFRGAAPHIRQYVPQEKFREYDNMAIRFKDPAFNGGVTFINFKIDALFDAAEFLTSLQQTMPSAFFDELKTAVEQAPNHNNQRQQGKFVPLPRRQKGVLLQR